MKINTIKRLKLILRLLIGGMFVATAIFKLLSLDEFELYIYSFGIFNYLTVTVLARVLIAFEMLTGLLLMLKQFYKQVWWLMLLSLCGFTLFLIYTAFFRNDDNCHCFGEFVKLNPLHSSIKNLITITLMFFIRTETDYSFRFRKWIIGSCVALAVIVPFVVVPMDALYNKFSSPNNAINIVAYQALQKDTALANFDVREGNHVVVFALSGCKGCKLGMKKINSIVSEHHLDGNRIKILIVGSVEGIEAFKKEFALPNYQFFAVPLIGTIDAVDGSFPTFLYVQDGEVVKSMSFRGVSEEELVDFLK